MCSGKDSELSCTQLADKTYAEVVTDCPACQLVEGKVKCKDDE
jgi:hypothetical protein